MMINQSLKTQLTEWGYCILPQVIDLKLLKTLHTHSRQRLSIEPPEKIEANRSLGTLIDLYPEEWLLPLITGSTYLNVLKALGAQSIRYSTSYLFNKFPGSPVSFWHQDWWAWKEPLSYEPPPPQIGLLCYLQDADEESGVLRVLPGSHRHAHPLHHVIELMDKKMLRQAKELSLPVFQPQAGEVAVTVKAGDLIIMDARLLHGAYANNAHTDNALVTSWYYPNYDQLTAPIQSAIGTKNPPAHWSLAGQQQLIPLLPNCQTTAPPSVFCEWPDFTDR